MKPPVERLRLSEAAKQQLIQLKRNTKIEQWNILCRWAFCLSLAEPSLPSSISITNEGAVEIAWDIFAGEASDYLILALKQRCYNDGLPTDLTSLKQQFRLHIHRGISYLAGNSNIKKIEDLIQLALSKNE